MMASERAVGDSERHEMFVGIAHIIGIAARNADTLADEPHQFGKRQAAGILGMARFDDIGENPGAPAIGEGRRQICLVIDERDLFALAQIGDGRVAQGGGDPEGDAPACAAAVEPEHEPRPIRRTAMDVRIDAQRAVIAAHRRERPFLEVESRPPHQRAIAEHPQIATISRHVHALFHLCRR